MKPLIIIPARYNSARFPGKPLALINDKPMIQHTYENAKQTGFPVIVATDDERIFETVKGFGGEVLLTGEHPNGTFRCQEASRILEQEKGIDFDVLINVQGDEPFIVPEQIKGLFQTFEEESVQIATLGKKIEGSEELFNSNVVKVVRGSLQQALYFSRAAIPHCRDAFKEDWIDNHKYFKHVGMYAYRKEVLSELVELPEGILEKMESLEQLRWLEAGYKIAVLETTHESIGVDTPEDLKRVQEEMKK